MNAVVVISGGLAETLQAATLVGAIAAGPDGPPLVMCPPEAAELAGTMHGAGAVLALRGLGRGGDRPGRLWINLRSRRIDTAYLCSERAGVRVAAFAAGVPRRIGCRHGISDALLTHAVPSAPDENRALAWARMTTAGPATAIPAGVLLESPAEATAAAERHLLETGIGDGRLLVALVPGQGYGTGPTEAWTAERFAHLANRLAARHGAGIVLLGDARDRGAAEALRVDLAADVVDLCGELDLATAAAVIARCDLLVSADTPLLQVAAAMGTPSVGLFARTIGRVRGAAGPEHRVVQALPDGGPASLDRIRVDDVLAAIEGAI